MYFPQFLSQKSLKRGNPFPHLSERPVKGIDFCNQIREKVGVIRVCGTAEFEENLLRNTEFKQFLGGTTEFSTPTGRGFSQKFYAECGIFMKFHGFADPSSVVL